jgi:hypothetical protein
VKLSVAVMAHPSRKAMVDELLEHLDRPAEVVWDRINDRHETGLRSLEAYDPSCSHHLVIQDDVLPCSDLVAGTEKALERVPAGNPASLYIGRVRPFSDKVNRAVRQAGDAASWITMDGIYWGPAIVVPTETMPEALEWFRSSDLQNYDRRLSRFYEKRKLRCWYSWPSLVDHRGDVSLAHRTKSQRRAHRWIGDESALSVDWSGDVVAMHRTRRLDIQRQRAVQA